MLRIILTIRIKINFNNPPKTNSANHPNSIPLLLNKTNNLMLPLSKTNLMLPLSKTNSMPLPSKMLNTNPISPLKMEDSFSNLMAANNTRIIQLLSKILTMMHRCNRDSNNLILNK